MKNRIPIVCMTLLALGAAWSAAAGAERSSKPADETSSAAQARPGSPEFERMKTLVGSWTGEVDMGNGPIDMTLDYRLLAGGSVLEERVFAGTPNEMVTMYYDQGGQLAMTHYCVFGNRPRMILKSSDAKTIRMDFDPTCGIDPAKESHMHAVTLTFEDADTLTASCVSMIDGQVMPEHPTTLKRVKD